MDIRKEHTKSRNYWDTRAKPWSASSASRSYLTEFYEQWKDRLKFPLLDVGCAGGKFLYRIVCSGMTDIYGIDISPKLIEMAREKLRPILGEETDRRIITSDMLDLSQDFKKDFFHTIIFSGVLQQTVFSAARRTLQEIATISAPTAIMYLSTRSISTPPQNGTPVGGESGTFRLTDGVVKTYFTRPGIEKLIDGLFEIIYLEEKDQTEKISGVKIKNWEGVLRRI